MPARTAPSYLMDYGPYWPPTPEPEPPSKHMRRRWSLPRTCAAVTLAYVLIAVAGLLALHLREQYGVPFDPTKPPAAVTSPATGAGPAHQSTPVRHR